MPEKQSAGKLFTQDEVNSLVAKVKGEYQAKRDELTANLAQVEAERAKATAEAEAATKAAAVLEVSVKHNIKPELREFLTAQTPEELDSQAQKLSENINVVAPRDPSGANPSDGWSVRP